jgi:hypothetical protein
MGNDLLFLTQRLITYDIGDHTKVTGIQLKEILTLCVRSHVAIDR